MTDGQNIFDPQVTYRSIQRIATGQGDDYTTGYLLDYNYFKNYYKMIVLIGLIDLCQQQDFDADLKAIQQTNFTRYLEKNSVISFITEEAKQTVSDFSKRTWCKSIRIWCFVLIQNDSI